MLLGKDSALIGHSGFVGGNLSRLRSFGEYYNSTNIASISGRSFDTLICSAAPANMWIANQNPEADRANLAELKAALEGVHTERFVLISTIAVFDDLSAGYTEQNARYETEKAYGLHRRALEEWAQGRFPRSHVLRLPALFGPGLKKNFVYDLINPIPSFIRPAKFDDLWMELSAAELKTFQEAYTPNKSLGMWELHRDLLTRDKRSELEKAFVRIGFQARNFTNSCSHFQYYNVSRLADDIERVMAENISLLNICSEPLTANEISYAITGQPFDNEQGPIIQEDVRSEYAAAFGAEGPYLFRKERVLEELTAFYREETAR